MNVSRLGIGSCALVALVGCSALDVQLADVGTRFDDSLAAGSAMASRLESYPNTEWSSVPGTGSARFVGKTLITVDAGVLNGTRISGDAVINVSFAGDTVTGTLDDFFWQEQRWKG